MSQSVQAQEKRYSFEFTGERLSEVLEQIVSAAETDLIYDPAILTDTAIYRRIIDKTMGETLKAVLEGTGLDYIILSSGTFVVIASSAGSPTHGSFTGRILDARTGEPLPGATIMLADASGGTAAGVSGHFNLNRLITGRHEIVFSYVGYNPVKKEIVIAPDFDVRETIHLHPRNVEVAPVVVSAHKPMPAAHDERAGQITDITKWETESPGFSPIQSLNLFSGVQSGIALTDIHIQGGQRGEHRLFLDGAPVYNPYSFGQLFSAFSPFAIGRVSVDKAGFDASAGSFISGKVNLEHDISNSRRQNFTGQADPLNTNLSAHFGNTGPEPGRFQMMAAFRSSFWDLYDNAGLSGTLQQWDMVDPVTYGLLLSDQNGNRQFRSAVNQSDINYYDFHTASKFRIDDFRNITYSLYSGRNFVETDMLAVDDFDADPVYMFSRDSYEWNNLVSSVGYNWMASPRLNLNFRASYSMNRMDHSYSMFDDSSIRDFNSNGDERALFNTLGNNLEQSFIQQDANLIRHAIVQGDFSYAFTPSYRISGGLQTDHVYSRFTLSDFFYLPTRSEQESIFFSGFLNNHWVLNGNLAITAGSRFTMFAGDSRMFAEPRVSIQYDQNESAIGYWSAKLAGGIYRQFINQFEITNVGPSTLVPHFTIWSHDAGFEQPKAYHTSLSFLVEPSRNTSARFETFVKIQPSSYITSYVNLMVDDGLERDGGLETFAEVTDMYSWGGSFRLHQSFLETRLQFLLGYDLTVTQINMDTQFDRILPAPWNEPHRLQGRVLARVTPQLSLIGKWQSVLGRTWAFRQAYYDFMLTHNVSSAGGFDFTNPGNDRLAPYHQLDFSVVYAPQLGFGNLELRLDLINVLNRQNSIDWNLNPGSELINGQRELEIRNRILPGFRPSVSVMLSF